MKLRRRKGCGAAVARLTASSSRNSMSAGLCHREVKQSRQRQSEQVAALRQDIASFAPAQDKARTRCDGAGSGEALTLVEKSSQRDGKRERER